MLQRIVAADADRWRLLVGRVARIRSAELHTYLPGGSVADPAHRDNGSLLPLSVLLSDAAQMEGGRFVTWEPDGPHAHELARGDAIVFASEKAHNVSLLRRGVRHSLVLELWRRPPNVHDRDR